MHFNGAFSLDYKKQVNPKSSALSAVKHSFFPAWLAGAQMEKWENINIYSITVAFNSI